MVLMSIPNANDAADAVHAVPVVMLMRSTLT